MKIRDRSSKRRVSTMGTMSRPRNLPVLVGILVLGVVAFAVGRAVGASTSESPSTIQGDHFRERYSFTTLEEMVTQTPIVIEGRVLSVEPGRKVGDPEGQVEFLEATVTAIGVLKAPADLDLIATQLHVEFIPSTPAPVAGVRAFAPFDPAQAWWQPDAEAIFFIRPAPSGRYQMISSQGHFYFDASSNVIPTRVESPDLV